MDFGAGVLTTKHRGVDGNSINTQEFIEHNTRSQRLEDHRTVIEHLKLHPPHCRSGKLIFLSVSEGGLLITTLIEEYAYIIIVALNWSGAGALSWDEELRAYLQPFITENRECPHNIPLSDCVTCSESILSKEHYDMQMNAMIQNPTTDEYCLNMTYKYRADAMMYPKPDYQKIRTPFSVVADTEDTFIESCDAFVKKAKAAGVDITSTNCK